MEMDRPPGPFRPGRHLSAPRPCPGPRRGGAWARPCLRTGDPERYGEAAARMELKRRRAKERKEPAPEGQPQKGQHIVSAHVPPPSSASMAS